MNYVIELRINISYMHVLNTILLFKARLKARYP